MESKIQTGQETKLGVSTIFCVTFWLMFHDSNTNATYYLLNLRFKVNSESLPRLSLQSEEQCVIAPQEEVVMIYEHFSQNFSRTS